MVGSSSLRRQALIRRMRPDLDVVHVPRQRADAAAQARRRRRRKARCWRNAGLRRLGLEAHHHRPDAARHLSAGAGAGRDLHREPDRRRARDASMLAADRPSADRAGAGLRAGLSRRARRLLPDADCRSCGDRRRQAVLLRPDPDARRHASRTRPRARAVPPMPPKSAARPARTCGRGPARSSSRDGTKWRVACW